MKAVSPGRARFSLQAAIAAFFFAAPWLTFGGSRVFGLDAPDGALRLFGARIPASDLFTALLAVLTLLFLLLWFTAALGRLWCGWLCPQSIISDAAAWVSRGRSGKAALHVLSIAFAILSSSTFLLYFLKPSELFSAAFFAEPGLGLAAFILVAVVVYLDMAWVGRKFCVSVCPYGKLLTVLTDREAVDVALDPARAKGCIDCGACDRACPMGLSVREGAGADCNRCGRCVDACSKVLERRGGGVVRFAVPPGGWLKGVALRPRYLPLLLLAFAAAVGFAWRAATDRPAWLAVRATPEVASKKLADGRAAIFLTARIGAAEGDYKLSGTDESGNPLELRGDVTHIRVGKGQAATIRFAVVAKGAPVKARLTLSDDSGKPVAETVFDVSALMEQR